MHPHMYEHYLQIRMRNQYWSKISCTRFKLSALALVAAGVMEAYAEMAEEEWMWRAGRLPQQVDRGAPCLPTGKCRLTTPSQTAAETATTASSLSSPPSCFWLVSSVASKRPDSQGERARQGLACKVTLSPTLHTHTHTHTRYGSVKHQPLLPPIPLPSRTHFPAEISTF